MKTITILLISWVFPFVLYSHTPDKKNISEIFAVHTRTANGNEFTLDLLRKNKASVLLFLSESCPICRKYTVEIRLLLKQFAEKNIEFYGVFPSPYITVDSVKNFARKCTLNFPMLIDSNQTITRLAGASITPEAVVISSNGNICYQGRIDNLFAAIGRQRARATTHELGDVLTALSSDAPVPTFKETTPIGCFIELLKSDE